MLLLAPQICCNTCLVFRTQTPLELATLYIHLPTICLWVSLKCFKKSSIAFTSTAVVFHERTWAQTYVRKGGIASDKENCLKLNTKQTKRWIKIERHQQLTTYKPEWCFISKQRSRNSYAVWDFPMTAGWASPWIYCSRKYIVYKK